MNAISTIINLSDIEVIANEPRVADLKIAEALGYAQHRDIRQLIERNIEALCRFGEFRGTCRENKTGGRGRPTNCYMLNEKQALYITAKSNTERAAEITVAMVEVFSAWRHGTLKPTTDRAMTPNERMQKHWDKKRELGIPVNQPLYGKQQSVEHRLDMIETKLDDLLNVHFQTEVKEMQSKHQATKLMAQWVRMTPSLQAACAKWGNKAGCGAWTQEQASDFIKDAQQALVVDALDINNSNNYSRLPYSSRAMTQLPMIA